MIEGRRVPLTQEKFAIVDNEDYDWLSQHMWFAHVTDYGEFRAVRNAQPPRSGVVYMHNEISGYARTRHINGNGLDNRRCNLEKSTQPQERWKTRKRRTAATSSKYKGVCWDKGREKWIVQIRPPGKASRYVGRFSSEIEAARAYDNAARLAFGEFAALNFPESGERSAHWEPPPKE